MLVMWIVTTVFFAWQVINSLVKLHDPPVIDTTEIISIEDVNLPVITFCPHEEYSWNKTALIKYGYHGDPGLLLAGISQDVDDVIGWGAQWDMTFKELVDNCTNPEYRYINSSKEVKIWEAPYISGTAIEIHGFTVEGVFVPAHPGYCFNIEDYGVDRDTLSIEIQLRDFYTNFMDNFDIYLTDKSLWTMTSPYLPSHWGPKISFKTNYLIEVEQVSNYDPKNPGRCRDYNDNDYQNCMNDRLTFLDCNPPWYSTQNPCTEVYDQSLIEEMFNLVNRVLKGKTLEKKCPKPCTDTQSKIQIGATNTRSGHWLTLTFNEKVLKRTKKFSYGWPEFGVDMGSHLGLWYGISFWSIRTFSKWSYKMGSGKVKENGLYTTLLDYLCGNN